jgi:hypothetical protein
LLITLNCVLVLLAAKAAIEIMIASAIKATENTGVGEMRRIVSPRCALSAGLVCMQLATWKE